MAVYRRADSEQPELVRFPGGGLQRRRVPPGDLDARPDLQRPPAARDARRPDAREHPSVRDGRVLVLAQRHGDPLSEADRARRQPAAGRDRLRAPVQLAHVPLRRRATRAGRCGSWPRRAFGGRPSPASTSCSRTARSSTRTSSGIFELHWLVSPGQALVSSEVITPEEELAHRAAGRPPGARPEQPREPARRAARRGRAASRLREIDKFEEGQHLRGDARGKFAAERAARVAAGAAE